MPQWSSYEQAVTDLSGLPPEERLQAVIATWTGEAESLSGEDVRQLFVDTWHDGRDLIDDRSPDLLRMLRWIAPVRDVESYLVGTLTIFRGAADDRGVRWTLDQPSASDGSTNLYRATTAASDVLGHFTGDGRNEVLVDPQDLSAVERISPV